MKQLITILFQSCFSKPATKATKELLPSDHAMLVQYLEACVTVPDLYQFRDAFALFTPQMSGSEFTFFCESISRQLRAIVLCNTMPSQPYMTWQLSQMFKKAASLIEVDAILTHIKRHRQAYIETNRPDLDIYTRMANKRKAELQSHLQNLSAI